MLAGGADGRDLSSCFQRGGAGGGVHTLISCIVLAWLGLSCLVLSRLGGGRYGTVSAEVYQVIDFVFRPLRLPLPRPPFPSRPSSFYPDGRASTAV